MILASSSPRRALLLRAAGISFEVVVPEVDESQRVDEPPAEYVLRLSEDKVEAVLVDADPTVVLGADTTVVLDGRSIGKPDDHDHAVVMLEAMAGRTHSVLTGWTARSGTERRFGVTESLVTFHTRSRRELDEYVAATQPFDKAGAYALQGDDGWLVASVRGSRSNVMGLPVGDVVPALIELGVPRSAPDRR